MVEDASGTVKVEAIHAHLQLLQSAIRRMADNSTSAKTWCITVTSAVLLVVADRTQARLALISLLPILMFLFLDAYYLALERGFREGYETFVTKVHAQTVLLSDLYAIPVADIDLSRWLGAIVSRSVLPFYICLILLSVIISLVVA